MDLDPKFIAFLASPMAQMLPVEQLTPTLMREMIVQYPAPLLNPPVHASRDLRVPVAAGDILVRLYTPSATRNLPLIVFFHGGGFVLGNIAMYDDFGRVLANYSGCAVASVDYRLAPEAPFPAPLEDCYSALTWLAANATELKVDAARLAVAGDSAGGNLATATTLLARDRGGPALRYQALFYPALDPACASASAHALATGYFLRRDAMLWFWKHYLQNPADRTNALAAPLHAHLAGLPPATVVTAEFDPLRDEGEAYADRLRDAGVEVIARRYLGVIHGFASMPYVTAMAQRALADVGADLKTALSA
jgi:acetyl esterase